MHRSCVACDEQGELLEHGGQDDEVGVRWEVDPWDVGRPCGPHRIEHRTIAGVSPCRTQLRSIVARLVPGTRNGIGGSASGRSTELGGFMIPRFPELESSHAGSAASGASMTEGSVFRTGLISRIDVPDPSGDACTAFIRIEESETSESAGRDGSFVKSTPASGSAPDVRWATSHCGEQKRSAPTSTMQSRHAGRRQRMQNPTDGVSVWLKQAFCIRRSPLPIMGTCHYRRTGRKNARNKKP